MLISPYLKLFVLLSFSRLHLAPSHTPLDSIVRRSLVISTNLAIFLFNYFNEAEFETCYPLV